MKKPFLIPIILVALLTGCEPTLVSEFNDRPVVEGFLHEGQPPVITISKLIPFKDDVDFSAEDVDKLNITLTDENDKTAYLLASKGEGKYSNESILVKEGHEYSISFTYGDLPVSAKTEIPVKPQNMKISATTITIGGFQGMSQTTKADPMGQLEVTWDNPDNSYYIVAVINEEAEPNQIWNNDTPPDTAFQLDPTNGSSIQIPSRSFSYYGNHKVVLLKIQPEYLIMCQASGNSSGSLTEVIANVKNGFGIFTGINSDSKSIRVYQNY